MHEVLTEKVDEFLAMTTTERSSHKTEFLRQVRVAVNKKYSLLQRELSFVDYLINMLNKFANLIRLLLHKPKYAMLQGFLTGKARDVEAAIKKDLEPLTPPPLETFRQIGHTYCLFQTKLH